MRQVPIRAALLIAVAFVFVYPGEIMGVTAPAKKKAVPKAAGAKIDIVPARRVLRDFRGAYLPSVGATEKKAAYAGGMRNFKEEMRGITVPVQLHRVSVDILIEKCGLIVRDTWEVRYYRLESEWIFDRIIQVGSMEIGAPKKKMPFLEDPAALSILRTGLGNSHQGWEIRDIVILKKIPSRKRCTARYLVTSKAAFAGRDTLAKTTTLYECLFRSTLENSGSGWDYAGDECVYRGKDQSDCFIETMCRKISEDGSFPPINDAEAQKILRQAFANEYGLKKNDMKIELFAITSRGAPEYFRSRIPFTLRTIFSIAENVSTAPEKGVPGQRMVRAVYECTVKAHLLYSENPGEWRGIIESCCDEGNEQCGLPCSYPGKGCRRLGEK
ncbi:MAG: hypothetical protein E4G96_00280 [Chrysiogenales bacterium]|nr:MAG: hypothetical protein E4G96_00280 [Chrysiogenales bacterium]